MPEFIARPDGLASANGFSHVVKATGTTVYVSGQVPVRADGSILSPDDVEAQSEQVFANLEIALAAAGASWSDVVKLTFYLVDTKDLPTIRAVRDRHVDVAHPPASSAVQVSALVHPDFRIEIDAVAVI